MRWWDQALIFFFALRASRSFRMATSSMWIARGVFSALWLYQTWDRRPTFSETTIVLTDFINWLDAHQYERAFFESPVRYLHLYFQTHDWEAPLCQPRPDPSRSSNSD